MVDSAVVFLVCVGYGYAHLIGNHALALGVLYACFVGDLLFFGTGMARDTYLAKIALKPEDVAPSLSLADRACLAAATVRKATAWTADRSWSHFKFKVPVELIRG